jgi:predicted transcriptional regulator of viral defense system
MKILDRFSQVDKIREYAKRTPVFDTRSVVRLIGNADYAYLLLNQLARTGEIQRLTKGYYTIHKDPSLIVYCLKPAYLGLQDAMSLRNLWEQETNPIILTTRRVRPGARDVMGSTVIVRRISQRYFFGYDYLDRGGFLLPVSDAEKTFIDMVYFNQMRKDVAATFRGMIDRKKVKEYLARYDEKFTRKVNKLV